MVQRKNKKINWKEGYAKLKSHIPETQKPKTPEEAAKIIDNIYRPVIKKQVTNAFIMGGKAAFKILYENFVEDILSCNNEEDKALKVNNLISYIKKEYDISENSKKEMKGEIENAAESMD